MHIKMKNINITPVLYIYIIEKYRNVTCLGA